MFCEELFAQEREFVMKKFVPVKLLLSLIFAAFVALMLTVAPFQAHDVHAAASTSAVTTHPNSSTYTCDYKTYLLTSTLRLVRNSDGYVFDFQASNLNGYSTVMIWHNGYYDGEYYLPHYDTTQIRIYVGYDGWERVDACID
jgi:hypothetical protein